MQADIVFVYSTRSSLTISLSTKLENDIEICSLSRSKTSRAAQVSYVWSSYIVLMDPNRWQPGGLSRHITNPCGSVPEVRTMTKSREFFETAIFIQDAEFETVRLTTNRVVVVGLIEVNDVLREVARQLIYELTQENDNDQVIASNSVTNGPIHEPSVVGTFKDVLLDLNTHTGKAQLQVDGGQTILHGVEEMNNFLRQTARKLQGEFNKLTPALEWNHTMLEEERAQSPTHSQEMLLSPGRSLPTIEKSGPDAMSSTPEAYPRKDESVQQGASGINKQTSVQTPHKTFGQNRGAHDCQMQLKLEIEQLANAERELNELIRFRDDRSARHKLGSNHRIQVRSESDANLGYTRIGNNDARMNTEAPFSVDFIDYEEQELGSESQELSKSTVRKETDPSLTGRTTAIAVAGLSGIFDGPQLGSIQVVLNATDAALWRQSNADAEAITGARLAGVEDTIGLNLVEAVSDQGMTADARVTLTTSDALRLNRENENCQKKLAQAFSERDEAVGKLVEAVRKRHETQTNPQIDDLLSQLAKAKAQINSVSQLRDDAIAQRNQACRDLATRTAQHNGARQRLEVLEEDARERQIREGEMLKQLEKYQDQEERLVVLKVELTRLHTKFDEQLNEALVKSEDAKRVVEAERDHYYEQVSITNAAIRKAQEDLRIATARAESSADNVDQMRLELENARVQIRNLEEVEKLRVQESIAKHQREAALTLEVVQAVDRGRNCRQYNALLERQPPDGSSGVPPSPESIGNADPRMGRLRSSRNPSAFYEAPKASKRKARNGEPEHPENKRR